jgi:hypothetical protein
MDPRLREDEEMGYTIPTTTSSQTRRVRRSLSEVGIWDLDIK